MSRSLHPALRARIASISILETHGDESRVLPSSSSVLGFQYRGRVRDRDGVLAVAGVTGIQATAKTYAYAPDTGSILVRFKPAGAVCLGLPAHELTNRSVPLDAIVGRARVADVSERLFAAPDAASRLAIVEAFLLSLPPAGDALVGRALARLEASSATTATIAGIARELGLSERQLERRFLARVGVTPKAYASLRRFERALELAPAASSLGALAQDAGYYDHSHFIREFRRFAGAPPRVVLART